MPAEVTGKVTEPPVPCIIGPLCEFATDTPFIVRVNGAETALVMVSSNVGVMPGSVDVFPTRVKIPELPLIAILPEFPTETPAGRFATDTGYESSAMFVVVTVKVAV